MRSPINLFMLLALLAMAGCLKPSTTTKTTNSNNNNTVTSDYCVQNPMGYGCPQFCQQNPTVCSEGVTGGTTTGTNGGGGTTSSGHSYDIVPPSDNNWTAMYRDGVPQPDVPCPTPTGTGLGLRKGTVTLSGGHMYKPDHPWSSVGDSEYRSIHYGHNNSSFLVDTAQAKQFIESDGKLRVRLKVRPQPKPPKGKNWCFNRLTGQSADPYGYRTLNFGVSIRGVNENGTLKPALESTKYVSAQVNGCSPVLDFSGDNQRHPHGIVLIIHSVQSDQGCWYSGGCTSMTAVRAGSCWSMDIEASVDGTQDI
jgi:hypothetical protein